MTTQIQIGGKIFEASALNLPSDRMNRGAWAIDPNDPARVVEDPALIAQQATERAAALIAECTTDSAVLKALGSLIAEVAFRAATAQLPSDMTRAQARQFVRAQIEEAIRKDLGIE